MKKLLSLVLLVTLITSCTKQKGIDDYTQFVNPYIGSGGHGHVFVGANVPHGMVQVGPQNINKGWDWCSGYHYSDSIVVGFNHTHLSGTGESDHGDIILMPFSGNLSISSGTQDDISDCVSSYYKHKNEKVAPGYYSLLMDNGIFVEMTATERTALHRFKYKNQDETNHLLINLADGNGDNTVEASLRKIDDYTLEGHRRSKGWAQSIVFFTLKTDIPIERLEVYEYETLVGENEIASPKTKGVITFKENPSEIKVKVGLSFVNSGNAALNMNSEIDGWDLKKVRQDAVAKWNEKLSQIAIRTPDEDAKKTFYTALYHYHFAPTIYHDINNEFRGHDNKIYTANDWVNYSTFSLWDTYRTWHPLLTILDPTMVSDIVNSMLSIYEQQGHLPIWALTGFETFSMPGYSSIPVIADACIKGIEGFDYEKALDAMIVSSTKPDSRKYTDEERYVKRRNNSIGYESGIPYLVKDGLIPYDRIFHATSKALEYAVGDWGISQVAKKIGKNDIHQEYLKRGKYYQLYFDKDIQFIRPKGSDGQWLNPYDPFYAVYSTGYFTEGNGWQYTFFAPQHPDGLIELFGSDKAFIQKLDTFFSIAGDLGEGVQKDISGLIGMYSHGNEPSHHAAYLYPYAGEQWKTAEKVRFIQENFYHNNPDGLIGNEDYGQMSAWHIMSALGFYQVNPSNGTLVLGSPQFDDVMIALKSGKTIQIKANNNNSKNIYIQSVSWNGEDLSKSFIQYEDIMQGGVLVFEMGDKPNKEFGANPDSRPVTPY